MNKLQSLLKRLRVKYQDGQKAKKFPKKTKKPLPHPKDDLKAPPESPRKAPKIPS
jgi:hypothetical protein